jgi:hypothetical protein
MKSGKTFLPFFAVSVFFVLALFVRNAVLAAGECGSCDSSSECDRGLICTDCRSQDALRNCPGSGCSDASGRCVPDPAGGGPGGGGGGNDCDKIGGVCVDKTADGKCSDGRTGVDYCGDSSKMCCGSTGGGGGGGAGGLVIPTTGLPNPPGGIAAILANFLIWLLYIVGMIALISFVVSGIQYFLAAGDEKTMEKAKRNFNYSVIGVVVVLSAFVIIKAVDIMLRGFIFIF